MGNDFQLVDFSKMASDIVRPLLDRLCDKAAFCSDAVNYSDLILSCNVMTHPIVDFPP